MRERLIIRLLSGDSNNVSWIQLNDQNEATTPEHFGSIEEAAALGHGRYVTLLAPSSEVVLTETEVPAIKKGRLQQIIPFALEEHVCEDINSLHFALGERDSETGKIPVAIVSRRFMEHWRVAIRDSGLHPHEIIPDMLALPLAENEWTVLIDTDIVLVRTGPVSGFSCDRENLVDILNHAIATTREARPHSLRLFDYSGGTLELEELEQLPPDLELNFDDPDDMSSAIFTLGRHAEATSSINLLSGNYSQQHELSKIWSPWRTAAIFVGVLILVQLISSVIQIQHLKGLEKNIRNEQVSIYKKTFPDKKRPPRFPRKQMQSELKSLKGSGDASASDLLDILSPVSAILKMNNAEIQNMNFRSGNLDLDIFMRDLKSVDQLKTKLTEMEGIEVEVKSVTTKNNRAEGTIRIRRTG